MQYPGSHLGPCACRKRLTENGRHFLCRHPRVHAKGNRVSSATCRICRFSCDKPPEQIRALDGGNGESKLLRRPERQMVVARYKEETSWLDYFSDWNPVVYDKGNPGAKNPLPNIGREAHTYLHHILENYDRLAELTVFLQGNPFEHAPDLYETLYGLDDNVGFRDLSDAVLAETADGNPFQPGLKLARGYRELFEEDPPEFFLCRASACFAVHREVIQSRPRAFYERLMRSVLDNHRGAWWIERHWHRVFQSASQTAGIVTAADTGVFEELRLMLLSLSSCNEANHPICVFDLGLTPEQRAWCQKQLNVRLRPLRNYGQTVNKMQRFDWWQTWLKPFYLFDAPFDRVLWIDTDCTIQRDIGELLDAIETGPQFFTDMCPVRVENDPRLYELLPVPDSAAWGSARLNAGVVGLCKIRDREILAAWAWSVQWAASNPRHHKLIDWADQGLLLWALHRTGDTPHIRDNAIWNCKGSDVHDLLPDAIRCGSLFKAIKKRYPKAGIVHWLGDFKLSRQLNRSLDQLIACGASNQKSSDARDLAGGNWLAASETRQFQNVTGDSAVSSEKL